MQIILIILIALPFFLLFSFTKFLYGWIKNGGYYNLFEKGIAEQSFKEWNLKSFDLQYDQNPLVKSFNEKNRNYEVNIHKLSCNCPSHGDLIDRFGYKSNNALCKHLCEIILSKKNELNLEKCEIGVFENISQKLFHSYYMINEQDKKIIIGYLPQYHWIEIFTNNLSDSPYSYRYSVAEERWSNNKSPRNSRSIIRIIKEFNKYYPYKGKALVLNFNSNDIGNILNKSIKEKYDRYSKGPLRAIQGSFDSSFFKDEEGRFKFPNYSHQSIKSIVKIKVGRDYKFRFWSALSSEQKANYSFLNFEKDISLNGPNTIEIEGFLELLKKSRLVNLPVFPVHNNEALLNEMIRSYEVEKPIPLFILSPSFQKLKKAGFIEEFNSIATNEYASFLSSHISFGDIRRICLDNDVRSTTNKIETIEILLNSGIKLPVAYRITDKFRNYVNSLIDLYFTDIQNSLKIFHPLFHEEIWVSARKSNNYSFILEGIQFKLKLREWERLLIS